MGYLIYTRFILHTHSIILDMNMKWLQQQKHKLQKQEYIKSSSIKEYTNIKHELMENHTY